MRVAVVGATGRIGRLTVAALAHAGHEAVGLSRAQGMDVASGVGLVEALSGVEAVVDAFNDPTAVERDAAVASFGGAARNLLAAEESAGVRHHVLLSIVNARTAADENAHFAGKVAQEDLVEQGDVPWTIVPATQFHDFAEMVSTWTEQNGSATVPPLLMQPVSPGDVAEVLAEIAVGEPRGRYWDVAGPRTEDLVDLARRTRAARGNPVDLVPSWRGMFGTVMAGEALLPAGEARITPTTFEEWLAGEIS